MSEQTAVPSWQGPDARGAGVRAGLRLAGPHGVAARQEHRALGNHERARRAEGPWCSMRQLDLTPRALSASRGCTMTFWVLDEATGGDRRPAESWPGRFSVASRSPQPSPNPAWKCGRVLRQPQEHRTEDAQPCCREAADGGEAGLPPKTEK